MKKTIIKLLVAALIVTGVGAGGYYGYKKYAASKKVTVSTSYINMTASKMNLQVNIQGTGAVYAANTKEIIPNNNGEIRDFNVNIGDTVKKGDGIATVYSSALEQSVSKASSNLQKQQLALNNSSSKQDIQLQNLTIQDSESELNSLLAQQQDSKVNGDQLRDNINKAKLNLEKQKIQLQKLISQSDNTSQKLAIQDAQNELTSAKEQLNKMTLTSPIDGLIISKTGQNGDNVQAAKSILTVIDTNSYKIKVAVDELDISKIKIGQKATIKFSALKDKVYEGAVEQVALTGTTSNNVTTYEVVVSVQNPENVMIGMNANVTINVNSKENALVVPIEAVTEKDGKKYVMVPSTSSDVKSSSNPTGSPTEKSQNSTGNTSSRKQLNSSGNANSNTGSNRQSSGKTASANKQTSSQSGNTAQFSAGMGKLVEIKTGLENENYVEVLEGISEGQKLLVALPKSTTSTSNKSNFGNMGGMTGGMGGNTSRTPGAGGGK